jgi:hypothetical protein
MHQVEEHVSRYVDPDPEGLGIHRSPGGRWRDHCFALPICQPAAARAGLPGITFHGLRHSFVAILVAAGCTSARFRVGDHNSRVHPDPGRRAVRGQPRRGSRPPGCAARRADLTSAAVVELRRTEGSGGPAAPSDHRRGNVDTRFRTVRAVGNGVRRVGLSGLEPLTSALSGQRSNRLSYRPAGRERSAAAPKSQASRWCSRPPNRRPGRLLAESLSCSCLSGKSVRPQI